MRHFATKTVYNDAARGQDLPALRLWSRLGERLAQHADIQPGERVLDVGCGVGAATFPAAQAAGAGGFVHGIDIASEAIRHAARRAEALQTTNIDFECVDLLEFRCRSRYDVTLGGFSLFFVDDIARAVHRVIELTKPRGRLAFSFWGPGCFDPPASILLQDVANVVPPPAIPPAPWSRFNTPDQIRRLFEDGERRVEIVSEATKYSLSVADWWTFVRGSGFRAFVDLVPPKQRGAFARRHLDRVRHACGGPDRIVLTLPVHYLLLQAR